MTEWLHPYVAAEQMQTAWRLLRERVWETDPEGWKHRFQAVLLEPK